MARDAQKQAKDTYKRGVDVYNDSSGKANQTYGNLFGQFEEDRKHPQGMAPVDLAAMDTADQQSLGGGVGAATGKANQQVAANRNSEGYAPALQESARDAMRIHSGDTLQTQLQNAMVREGHQNRGIEGESNLFKAENNNVLESLGAQNQSTKTLVDAGKSGWFQNMIAMINAVSNAASAAKGLKPSAAPPADEGGWV